MNSIDDDLDEMLDDVLDEMLDNVHKNIGVQILPAEIQSDGQAMELMSNLALLVYLGIMESLFLNLFMNKY